MFWCALLAAMLVIVAYVLGCVDGRRKGYDRGFNAGLIEGSKDTPFHVRRTRADAHYCIKLAHEAAAVCIDQMRSDILQELDECAKRYADPQKADS